MSRKLQSFESVEQWYGSLLMGAVIICFAVYLIFIKRWNRFEWTIVLCMFMKYALFAFGETDAFKSYDTRILSSKDSFPLFYEVYWSLWWTLDCVCHWIYAS